MVESVLAACLPPAATLAVGLSGGVDSMVLLDVLTGLAPQCGWRLSAVHVHHGLSGHADAWARFCRGECRARGVPLKVVKVTVARGNSVEAAARMARYAVYRGCGAGHVVLAHHQDDQAETLLLRLLRGAGVRGLAAMPALRKEGPVTIVRPLLAVTRAEIEGYARMHDVAWVTDDSNADSTYLRNYLRAEILPRIAVRAPGWRATLARASSNLADAALLLDDLALLDGGADLSDGRIAAAQLAALTLPRARNLLRYFLGAQGLAMPDRRKLDEILRQAVAAKADARLRIGLQSHVLYRYGGFLHVVREAPHPGRDFEVTWRGGRRLAVPALGASLGMTRTRGAGISLACLRRTPVTLRLRAGGERLQPDALRPRRDVKSLLRERGVPPWQRDRLPFLWAGERLAWVAGLGVDRDFQAAADEPAVLPTWHIDESERAV